MLNHSDIKKQEGQDGSGRLRGLIVVNVCLLVLLAGVTYSTTAIAQGARGRGEYTMVAGGVPGANSAAVYIVDVQNQEMVAMTYDFVKKEMEGLVYQNLAMDAARTGHGGGKAPK